MSETRFCRNGHWALIVATVVAFSVAVPVSVFSQTAALVKDINYLGSNPGVDGFHWTDLTECGSYLYFNGESKSTGEELWRTDGTEAGTQLVLEIGRGVDQGVRPRYFACVGSTLFFAGSELWKTDGTALGTSMVVDINPGSAGSYPKNLTSADGLMYFQATDGLSGEEPWVSDGSETGTFMLGDLRSGSTGSIEGGTEFFEYGGRVYFCG